MSRRGAGTVIRPGRHQIPLTQTVPLGPDVVDVRTIEIIPLKNKMAHGGGAGNIATSEGTSIVGGSRNKANGKYASIGGGYLNGANEEDKVVAGGRNNEASGVGATVGGGAFNFATGKRSTIPGGFDNRAAGFSSFAAGTRAKANHSNSFVFHDGYPTPPRRSAPWSPGIRAI